MYEFEFWDEKEEMYVYMFGYSLNDLKNRSPDVNFESLKLVSKEYID